jgi:hypothetical protein
VKATFSLNTRNALSSRIFEVQRVKACRRWNLF